MSQGRRFLFPFCMIGWCTAVGCRPDESTTFGDGFESTSAPTITAACTEEPTTLASIPGIRGDLLLLDDAALYVAAHEGDGGTARESIYRVPKIAPTRELVASAQGAVGGMAIGGADASGGTAIYWSTGPLASQPTGAIWKVAALGGAPVALVSGRATPGPIVVGPTHVYWAEAHADGAAIVWAPLEGGNVTTWQILPGQRVPATLLLTHGTITWSAMEANATRSNVAASILPLPFGEVLALDTRAGPPVPIASSAGDVLLGGAEGVTALSLRGVPKVKIATSGPVRSLDADDAAVYLIDSGLHALFAALPDPLGGPPRRLASDVADGSLRFDAACVYFVDAAAQAIRMVHR